jgi:hypothetical protein
MQLPTHLPQHLRTRLQLTPTRTATATAAEITAAGASAADAHTAPRRVRGRSSSGHARQLLTAATAAGRAQLAPQRLAVPPHHGVAVEGAAATAATSAIYSASATTAGGLPGRRSGRVDEHGRALHAQLDLRVDATRGLVSDRDKKAGCIHTAKCITGYRLLGLMH